MFNFLCVDDTQCLTISQHGKYKYVALFCFPEIASCESDIAFFSKRRHPDTRQWFFDDFDEWFLDPGDSRAYVLQGDPGVGKSVMAGVMAQRMRETGHLGAAYFCRHNDGTRNDPRYLLGTVARQLCDCSTEFKVTVGGENGVKMLLGNSKLGVRELFTKLLQEPLNKCSPCGQRKLVIIDALDETEYDSREDFLDLITDCFPLLPKWLVFFITSRPEDSVQFRLKNYNPCIKICAGNSDQDNFYQQHEQDIQTFLKTKVDFSRLSVTVEDISKKCNGLFLYAHYIVEELKLAADSGKELNQLSDLFPGDIDRFFLQNFKRVHDQVGQDIFKKLFGCAIVSPAPLPLSTISYILKKENSNHDEQQVIDAVSQFVVLRKSDQTLTFLHNLIPTWLTDKKKASRKLFIDKKIAGEYLGKIFVEILPSILNESRPTCLSTDADLENYVSCIAIRFLCQNGVKDSLKTVFDCLTSYHFIARRIQSGRIEIYHLLDDLRLAASCLSFEEVWKQVILQEILFALENNALVLLECPHLLNSCIRNASNTVRENVSIPQMSTPSLEWFVCAFPDPNIAAMNCFATSPDRRTVVGSLHQFLYFFDVSTVEKVSGPFDVSKDVSNGVKCLEFSPDGKFIFFGRLDKWFSVERCCVEDFPQFSGNSHMYKWGVFAPKGQCIVVKKDFLMSNPTTRICEDQSCLFNLLSLWALKEIEQSRDDEMTISCCHKVPHSESGVQNERFFHLLGLRKYLGRTLEHLVDYNPSCHCCSRVKEVTQSNQEPSLSVVRQLVIELYPLIFNDQVWDLQTGTPKLQQVFSKGIQLNPITYLCHVTCALSKCAREMGCTGIERAMSVCNIAVVNALFCRDSFCYRHAMDLDLESVWELEWTNRQLEQERSRLLVILEKQEKSYARFRGPRYSRIAKLEVNFTPSPDRRTVSSKSLREVQALKDRLARYWVSLGTPEKMQLLKEVQRFQLRMGPRGVNYCNMSAALKELHSEALKCGVLINIDEGFQNLVYDVNEEIRFRVSPETKRTKADGVLKMHELLKETQRFELKMELMRKEERIMSTVMKEFHGEEFTFCFRANIDEGFQNLFYDRNGEIGICVSPETKRIVKFGVLEMLKGTQRFELKMELKRKGECIMFTVMKEFHNEEFNFDKGFQNLVCDENGKIRISVSPETKRIGRGVVRGMRLFRTGNQDRHVDHHGNPEHIVSKFTHFTLTIDDLYFVYSCEGSLHALSLQTGKVLTSVSGCNLIYLRKQRQFGYLFRSVTEEREILLTSLFDPFKFFAVSPVKSSDVEKSISAIFRSSNTVLSVSSDSRILIWEITTNKESITFICQTFLTKPGLQSLSVKNWLLSSDGRLIAIHHKPKVELYSSADSAGEKTFLSSVYESECEFTVPCFAFSADSTLLLFCIQDNRRCPHLYVWDVQQKVMANSLESPSFLTIECCCFSWDKRLVILCGDYEIEILEYAENIRRRYGVERPYHSIKFGQCTVSVDNQLLVCCIDNRILIYNLLAPNNNSSKQVLRGHLGRIEFCRFLKVNRYLISYGVDGVVFLWDISEFKAVAFARLTQEKEKIVAMAVSPEEDLAVCFTSSGRVCMIKLCGLGAAPTLKPLTSSSKGKMETAESNLQIPRQIASISAGDDMAETSSSSDSEEDINEYYQEDDDDVYFV